MARLLSIDYGSKRCGIAVTDPMQLIASPLDTVASHELMNFLVEYFKQEEVQTVVLGKPLQMNGEPSESFLLADRFRQAFRKRYPGIPIVWEDERYTSAIASRALIEGGMKKSERKNKAAVDKVSAALILQSYMDGQTL
jgi:putative Holliday junction resolvase